MQKTCKNWCDLSICIYRLWNSDPLGLFTHKTLYYFSGNCCFWKLQPKFDTLCIHVSQKHVS